MWMGVSVGELDHDSPIIRHSHVRLPKMLESCLLWDYRLLCLLTPFPIGFSLSDLAFLLFLQKNWFIVLRFLPSIFLAPSHLLNPNPLLLTIILLLHSSQYPPEIFYILSSYYDSFMPLIITHPFDLPSHSPTFMSPANPNSPTAHFSGFENDCRFTLMVVIPKERIHVYSMGVFSS